MGIKLDGPQWRTMDYWELNKVVSHPCSYEQHCYHLRCLGHDTRSVLCSAGFSRRFFSVYLWSPSRKNNLSSCWRKDLSSASPRIPNSLTTCHGMAVHDLAQFFPAPVKWTQYIDDIMLTCEYLPLLQDALQGLLEHLRGRGWTVKLQKIQGPVTTVRFQMCLVG